MKLNSIRGRLLIKRLIKAILIILLVALVAAVCTFFYYQRYVVYTQDGISMDFDSYPINEAVTEEESTEQVTKYDIDPQLVIDEALDPALDPDSLPELEQLSAVYITYDELLDVPALEARLEGLEYNALVLCLKRDHGNVNYPSSVASEYTEGNTALVSDFIDKQSQAGIYLVAELCCFRDDLYSLEQQSEGLPITGGALWVDGDSYYWLNAASTVAQDYIISLGKELKAFGFSEILLDYFCFPTEGNTSSIVYNLSGSKTSAINEASENVVTSLQSSGLRVSLVTTSYACKNQGNSEAGWDMTYLSTLFDRIYVNLEAGSEVKSIVSGLNTASGNKIQMKNWLVFITSSNDTRFADYGIAKKEKQ